jgi:hypothetical protein
MTAAEITANEIRRNIEYDLRVKRDMDTDFRPEDRALINEIARLHHLALSKFELPLAEQIKRWRETFVQLYSPFADPAHKTVTPATLEYMTSQLNASTEMLCSINEQRMILEKTLDEIRVALECPEGADLPTHVRMVMASINAARKADDD